MPLPLLALSLIPLAVADAPEPWAPAGERFVATSAFMLFNLIPWENPPGFAQLNVGWRLTPKTTLTAEAITWKYHAPLGIPYGPDYDQPEHLFPGHARDIGVGLAIQRFVWRGAYVAAHATPFLQRYYDTQGEHIQSGFQLFCTARAGYHFKLWSDRVFVEPSVAFTAWPVNTNLPDDFATLEEQWPGYFLFEPGLNVGMTF